MTCPHCNAKFGAYEDGYSGEQFAPDKVNDGSMEGVLEKALCLCSRCGEISIYRDMKMMKMTSDDVKEAQSGYSQGVFMAMCAMSMNIMRARFVEKVSCN